MERTILRDFDLPSKGLIYKIPFDPNVQLRSMTIADDMKRLQPSDDIYRVLADVIDGCIESKLPMSCYDMCLGDFEYLLYKLRIVSYGSAYGLSITCPYCGEVMKANVNIEELDLFEYDEEDVKKYSQFTLPKSNDHIVIKFMTPRIFDMIGKEKKEMRKRFPDQKGDPTLLLTLSHIIESVNGKEMNTAKLQEYIKSLTMMDVNYISQMSDKLNNSIGVDKIVEAKCDNCGSDLVTLFKITNEFFSPSLDG